MAKQDLLDLKSWVNLRKVYLLRDLSLLEKKIFETEKKIKSETDRKKKQVLKDVLSILKADKSNLIIKLSDLDSILARANDYLEELYPEPPILG
ncbi:MAG: hypothetical protein QXG39_10150 [Candidatus Aenigmatarchaeota archaeon]